MRTYSHVVFGGWVWLRIRPQWQQGYRPADTLIKVRPAR